jgi:hypothetical protein
MARRLKPFVEREATWAVALAALGFISMYATLPAAAYLGVKTIRRRRGGDGSEPALAILAFGFVWLSFLLAYPAMRVIVLASEQPGAWMPRAFLGSVIALAAVILVLARAVVGMHPERWLARRAVMAGIVVAVAATFVQAMALVLGGLPAWSNFS